MNLYFDVFIVADYAESSLNEYKININNSIKDRYLNRTDIENKIRSSCYSYRLRNKLEISMYTLTTYSYIEFDKVIIKFECEDKSHVNKFKEFCTKLFPNGIILNTRSDTAIKYFDSIEKLFLGNPWIFFSPNNDHPFVGKDNNFNILINVAEQMEIKYSDHIIGIYYSHMSDMLNMTDVRKCLWGNWAFVFPKVIFENENCIVLKLNKFCGDSIQILRRATLLKLFKDNQNEGRVIRLEDLTSYFSSNIKHIIIVPKNEKCRHFDGSFHSKNWPSLQRSPHPLIIPDGFFNKNISIRYGYEKYNNKFININPLFKGCKYLNVNFPDLNIHMSEIPLAWKDRINKIDINKDFIDIDPLESFHRKQQINAYYDMNKLTVTILTLYKIIKLPLKLLIIKIHIILYKYLNKTKFHVIYKRFKNFVLR